MIRFPRFIAEVQQKSADRGQGLIRDLQDLQDLIDPPKKSGPAKS
jgi:hypothetical protein